MKFIKKYWLFGLVLIFISIIIKQYFTPPEIIKVPIKIEVPVPVVSIQFDTIKEPYPIYLKGKNKIDSIYYKEYLKLKDSISRDSLFKDAIAIREYQEKIEDDTISINLYMKVRGTLLKYQVGYKTKPRTISLDTIIKIPIPKKVEWYYGGDVYAPTPGISTKIGAGPTVLFIPKSHKQAYSIGYDVINREVRVSFYWRF